MCPSDAGNPICYRRMNGAQRAATSLGRRGEHKKQNLNVHSHTSSARAREHNLTRIRTPTATMMNTTSSASGRRLVAFLVFAAAAAARASSATTLFTVVGSEDPEDPERSLQDVAASTTAGGRGLLQVAAPRATIRPTDEGKALIQGSRGSYDHHDDGGCSRWDIYWCKDGCCVCDVPDKIDTVAQLASSSRACTTTNIPLKYFLANAAAATGAAATAANLPAASPPPSTTILRGVFRACKTLFVGVTEAFGATDPDADAVAFLRVAVDAVKACAAFCAPMSVGADRIPTACAQNAFLSSANAILQLAAALE